MSGHLLDSGHPRTSWACLVCRRVFKRVWQRGVAPMCGVCRSPLRSVGKWFTAPPANNIAQWRKVEALLASGVTFGPSYGGEPRPPKYLSELPDFLHEQRDSQERAARQIRKQRAEAPSLARRREMQLARKRKKRLAEKKLHDEMIERQARAANSSSPASHASST